jgi:hypothetical protein
MTTSLTPLERAALRDALVPIMRAENTGRVTPDAGDPTRYAAMAVAALEHLAALGPRAVKRLAGISALRPPAAPTELRPAKSQTTPKGRTLFESYAEAGSSDSLDRKAS